MASDGAMKAARREWIDAINEELANLRAWANAEARRANELQLKLEHSGDHDDHPMRARPDMRTITLPLGTCGELSTPDDPGFVPDKVTGRTEETPMTTMMLAPLPKGVEDTPEIREALQRWCDGRAEAAVRETPRRLIAKWREYANKAERHIADAGMEIENETHMRDMRMCADELEAASGPPTRPQDLLKRCKDVIGIIDCDECGHSLALHLDRYGCDYETGDAPCGCKAENLSDDGNDAFVLLKELRAAVADPVPTPPVGDLSRSEFQSKVVKILDAHFPPQCPAAYQISGEIYDDIVEPAWREAAPPLAPQRKEK